MMSLNKFVAVAFLLVTASFQVEAQGGGGMRGGAGGAQAQERMREMLFKDITLDETQTKKIDSISTATAAKRQEMMQAARGGGGDRQAMMQQFQAMQAEERKAIRDVLTADQQATFDKNVENMPAMGAGGGRRPPPQR